MRPTPPTPHAFARALLDASLPPPAGLHAWNGSDPALRFAIYRNNVVHSLVAVLADTFPVVQQLVGSDFFDAMARLYLVDHPPTSPLMHRYGAGLPAWIADFEPATSLPYLSDIARLEWARLCAFHAADAEPIHMPALAALIQVPERLASASLALHPTLAIVRSAHPIVSLWATHQLGDADRDARLSEVRLHSAEAALVFRDAADDALVIELPDADAALTAAIATGAPLGTAQSAHPHADLVQVLSLLLQHGLVTGVGEPRSAPETSA
jgi:hypothetical protein